MRAPAATGGVLTSAGVILAGTFLVRTALVPGLTLALRPMAGWSGRRWMRGLDPIEGAVETNSAQAGGTE